VLTAFREVAATLLVALPLGTTALGLLISDLIKRNSTEQALKVSEARLRAITQALPDLLLVIDEDGRYLDIICSERSLLYDDRLAPDRAPPARRHAAG